MKATVVFLLCLVVPLVYCDFIVDDFLESQTIDNIWTGADRTQVEPATVGSNLYYARQISSRKLSNDMHMTIGGGSAINVASQFIIGDAISFEYWYSPTAPNFPAGTSRADNPFPAGYIDLTNYSSLVANVIFRDTQFTGASLAFEALDTNGVTEGTFANPEILTNGQVTHLVFPIEEVFRPFRSNRARLVYFKFTFLMSHWDFLDFYFDANCQSPSNDVSTAAVPIPVNYASPASFLVETCGDCNAADFTGFQSAVQRNNVFWYSIAQQNTAYSVTFSSQSFSGFDDAYLFIFDTQGNLRAEIDNLEAQEFALTVAVNEIPLFVAFGANCGLQSYSLDVSFSTDINEVILRIEELEEALTGIINTGFTATATQIGSLAAELTAAEGNIIDEINQSEGEVEGTITAETTQIDNSLAALASDLAGVNTDLQNLLNTQFTSLGNNLNQHFGDVDTDLTNIADLIDTQCGSATDGVTALATYLTSQWNNYKTLQMVDKLLPAAVVPAIYATPATQGGLLDDVYAFVTSTYNTKLTFANSQKLTANTCKPGADGAYCAFFYRFPSQTGSAQSTYLAAMASYSTWMQQGRYANAFRDLSTAYNALFFGQK